MQATFQQLNKFLLANQTLWRFEPFHSSREGVFSWPVGSSPLQSWLTNLTITQIETLKQHPKKLIEELSCFVPDLDVITQLIQLPHSELSTLERNLRLEKGIPGRKLTQIQSLGQSAINLQQGSEWLEWCSGKGYLGRILSFYSKTPVVSFEYQQQLCEEGQKEADSLSLPMKFVQGDAFCSQSQEVFHSDQHVVALHACGDLHVRLMHCAAKANSRAISLSPCCYHLIEAERYQAQSQLGKSSGLTLSKTELRIPLQETVTGGERVKRHRQQEMSFRLGLDVLLREHLGVEQYCPIPSIKKSLLNEGFTAFCGWAADQKQFDLPAADFSHYESIGIERFWQMERLSLLQQGFRRLLEMWLVMDKAMFLEERGYRVELSEFCSREVTPRNILLHAIRHSEET